MTIQVGEIYTSNNYGDFKVIEYVNCNNIKVQFVDTGFITTVRASCIRKGEVKDKLKPVVHGVGFIGEGKYSWSCHKKIYQYWHSMLGRCYYSKFHERNPTYMGCTVHEDWHNFQVFAKWYDENYPKDGLTYHLDKDIKLKGNKVYGPSTCTWLTCHENTEFALAKNCSFISPEGELVKIYNLANFCRGTELRQSHMSALHLGKLKSYKGWTKA